MQFQNLCSPLKLLVIFSHRILLSIYSSIHYFIFFDLLKLREHERIVTNFRSVSVISSLITPENYPSMYTKFFFRKPQFLNRKKSNALTSHIGPKYLHNIVEIFLGNIVRLLKYFGTYY